jgi:hypothetical protein
VIYDSLPIHHEDAFTVSLKPAPRIRPRSA